MIKEAIDRVLSLAVPQFCRLEDGREAIVQQGKVQIMDMARPASLVLNTLTGLRDYIVADPDELRTMGEATYDPVVQVVDPTTVALLSPLHTVYQQRRHYATATADPKQFRFDTYMDHEQFMIALQTYFVQNDTTAKLIQLVGNIRAESGVNTVDDGVSQQVTAKVGVATLANVVIPNPVTLAPYRTFLEVEQPASKFVLRIKLDNGVKCALFSADGGNWQLDAIQKVAAWLKEELPQNVRVLA